MIKTRYTAAVTDKPWWLAGGIPASACVAAYKPIGASDYAASKINLVSPGLYNATDGAAYPTWSVTSGWIFAGASSQFLNVSLTPTKSWSTIVRFSGVSNGANSLLFGAQETTWDIYHIFVYINGKCYWRNSLGSYNITPGYASGVVGLIGLNAYADGVWKSAIADNGATYSTFGIGTMEKVVYFLTGNIQAFAIYNDTLNNDQVAALTAAMNAL